MIEASTELSPYRGLAAFGDEDLDARLFFGRDREIEIVTANLQANRLTVLYGASGVGKSSLVNAGVVHRLRADGRSGAGRHVVAVCSGWRGAPLAAVASATAAALEAELGAPVPVTTGRRLVDQLAEWGDVLGGEIYLVLDQLEEYVLYHGSDRGGPLAEALAEIVTRPSLRVGVLVGIRDDALAELDAFKARVPGLYGNLLRLDHLTRDEGREAVVGPLAELAQLGGRVVTAEPELVERVLDEVSAGRIALGESPSLLPHAPVNGHIEAPFLQLVMERVWEVERSQGSDLLRSATLSELGGAGNVVEEHLDHALTSLDGRGQSAAAAMFGFLVTPSGTKIAHRADDLARYAAVDLVTAQRVLEQLADARILRRVADDGGGPPRFEIFHDVLGPAVLAAVARDERDRVIATERRRRKRAVAVAAVALGAVGLMAAVTVYALDQRSSARDQATAAQVAKREAERQASAALSARADARQAQAAAEQSAADAQAAQAAEAEQAEAAVAAQEEAESQAAAAEASQEEAQSQAAAAETAQQQAEAAEADAQAQAERAEADEARAARAALTAEAAQRRAEREAARARAATRRAEGDTLTSQAALHLLTDPEASLQLALDASSLHPTVELERVLRSGLLAYRTLSVLPADGGVRAVAYSPDGGTVVVAGDGGTARTFGVGSGRPGRVFRHGAPIAAVAFSPRGGDLLATAGRDGITRLWDVRTGALARELRQDGAVIVATFSPDGRLLATGGAGQKLAVWEVETGVKQSEHEFAMALRHAEFSPDGALLLAVARDARLFDVGAGSLVAVLDQRGRATSAAFGAAGRLVATGSEDDTASIWDARTGRRLHVLRGHRSNVRGVAFDPTGARLVTTGSDATTRIWDVESGAVLDILAGHELPVNRASFSPDGSTLLTASGDGTARLWIDGGIFATPLTGHREAILSAAFAPDGRTVLTGSLDGSARLWLASRIDPTARVVVRHEGAALAVALGPDGEIVTGGADGTARIWRRGALVRSLEHPQPVTDVTVLPAGNLVTASEDGRARIWAAGRAPARELAHGGSLSSVAADADGTLIATAGSNGEARLWQARTGRMMWKLKHGAEIAGVALSPDGTIVATAGGDKLVKLWRVADGTLLRALAGHGDLVTSVAFSPDGARLVSTSRDADGRVWNVATGGRIGVLSGHSAVVSDAQFSPDGRWIVTAGPVTAGIWDATTLERLLFVRGHGPRVRSVAVGAGGRIVTTGDDGTVREYRCALCGELPALARIATARLAAATRWLTPAERTRHVSARPRPTG
jgi:WD40 repeat protein